MRIQSSSFSTNRQACWQCRSSVAAEEESIFDQIEDHMRSHGKRKPLVVHRIDRDTSGVVLFAKDQRTHAALKRQFRAHTPERVYLAVVYGHPEPSAGIWRDHLVWDMKALIQKESHPRDPRAAEAISHYRVVDRFETTSLIEVRLKTGKRNQIRIQSRLRGHTLVGEVRYTYGPKSSARSHLNARRCMHGASHSTIPPAASE